MSVVQSLRDYSPHLRFESETGKTAFTNALLALLEDCDLGGYVPRPSTLKEFQMLESVVADMRLALLDDEDEDELDTDTGESALDELFDEIEDEEDEDDDIEFLSEDEEEEEE